MILSSHLCLLSDGSFGLFPVAHIDADGRIKSLTFHPDGPEEIGGMRFSGGVMVCGSPDSMRYVRSTSRKEFAKLMEGCGVAVGRYDVAVYGGADLNTFCGTFCRTKISTDEK